MAAFHQGHRVGDRGANSVPHKLQSHTDRATWCRCLDERLKHDDQTKNTFMKERIWIYRVASELVSLGCKVVGCLCLGAMSVLLLEGESNSEVSEAHNIRTPLLGPVAHSDIGPMIEELLDEEVVGQVGVCCHFALDVLCAELHNF